MIKRRATSIAAAVVLVCAVVVINTVTATGASTAKPEKPTNTTLPTISGTPQQGQTLTASTGSWSGSPTSYGYQWRRCNTSGSACANISLATASTYTAVAADVASTALDYRSFPHLAPRTQHLLSSFCLLPSLPPPTNATTSTSSPSPITVSA